LVSKTLSDEIFCPTKILSNEILSDKVLYMISFNSDYSNILVYYLD